MDSGQISHRRALVVGCGRHCRCRQTSVKSSSFVDLCNICLKKTTTRNNQRCSGPPNKCRSWLACDGIASVCQIDRGDAIAGKPAPTEANVFTAR
ncbi:hypothetical protein FIV38_00645 [Pseudomonas proteolytica]|nr:hypothetical protein F4W61_08430 [Pseudomonas proteolytica]QHG25575.1 hypothetical protein GDV60_23035 [Pseudomonas sp. DTU12.1]TWR86430.1 hypothetical protein FIV38_00645 [Pseudomonas proteolytica]